MPTVHEVLCSHLYNIELVMGEDILALRMSIQCPMLSKTQWQLDYFFFVLWKYKWTERCHNYENKNLLQKALESRTHDLYFTLHLRLQFSVIPAESDVSSIFSFSFLSFFFYFYFILFFSWLVCGQSSVQLSWRTGLFCRWRVKSGGIPFVSSANQLSLSLGKQLASCLTLEISTGQNKGEGKKKRPDGSFKHEAQTALFKDPVRTAQ